MSRRTKDFKYNKIIGFIAELLLPYHWAYRKGLIKGRNQSNYYKGYVDGQQDGMEYIVESHTKFFDKQDFRKTGKK